MKPHRTSAARAARGRVQVCITLSPSAAVELRLLAERHGVSRSAVVESWIRGGARPVLDD